MSSSSTGDTSSIYSTTSLERGGGNTLQGGDSTSTTTLSSPATNKRLSLELCDRVEDLRLKLQGIGDRAAALSITDASPGHVQARLTACLVSGGRGGGSGGSGGCDRSGCFGDSKNDSGSVNDCSFCSKSPLSYIALPTIC